MTDKKDHKVEIFKDGYRWIVAELSGTVTFTRDGAIIGKARWKDDQFLDSTAVLPDAVSEELEQKLKKLIEDNYFKA